MKTEIAVKVKFTVWRGEERRLGTACRESGETVRR
jgi:hypothetical protein